jgi:hypothetical protein
VNPSLHLDLALNLVVLQFVDDNGNVTSQIPSQKQLKAYQAQEAASAPGGQAAPAVKTAQAAPAGAVPGGSAQPGSGPSSTAPSDLVQTGVTQSYAAGVIKAPASTAQPVSAPVRPAGVDQSGD